MRKKAAHPGSRRRGGCRTGGVVRTGGTGACHEDGVADSGAGADDRGAHASGGRDGPDVAGSALDTSPGKETCRSRWGSGRAGRGWSGSDNDASLQTGGTTVGPRVPQSSHL